MPLNPLPPDCPIPHALGNVPGVGPQSADILFLGEAAGKTEAFRNEPFVGLAGFMLDRILGLVGIDRSSVRIKNRLRCHPPNDWLIGSPWERSAMQCIGCRNSFEDELRGHKVVVPLGGTALRSLLDLPKPPRGKDSVRVQDFHGAPFYDERRGIWIVSSFHPSHLQQGAHKLIPTVCFDIKVAQEVAAGTYKQDLPELVKDPPVDWFEAWAEAWIESVATAYNLEAALALPWLACDIETPDKEKKSDEGELGREDASWQITRINLSYSTGQGVTVPWVEPYRSIVKRLLLAWGLKAFWNLPYDGPRLERDLGIRIAQPAIDFMDAWHVWRSDHPRGLGYVAPFASNCPPWKHLGSRNLDYCAMDGVQTLRIAYWIYGKLLEDRMWDVFIRNCYMTDVLAFRPGEAVGLPIDAAELTVFTAELSKIVEECDAKANAIVPEEWKPVSGALVNRPEDSEGNPEPGIIEKKEKLLVKVCERCGAEQVSSAHKCEDLKKTKPKKKSAGSKGDRPSVSEVPGTIAATTESGVHHSDAPLVESPRVVLRERVVPRFYRRLPFNPASWQQVLEYVKKRGHKPGKAKKTKKDSVDKKALLRLQRTGDPLYPIVGLHKQAGKLRGTYGEGMLRRLDSEGRVHALTTHVPSTLRTSMVDPNLQNMASHVRFADGFRRCVKARAGCKFLALDFAGIEAVEVGWLSGDPNYIRLAKLGIHAYVESHVLHEAKLIGEAADTRWSDADLKKHFGEVKGRFPAQYDQAKRCVHGYNYGLTEYGMADNNPDLFPKRSDARKIIDIYEAVCPKLKGWQKGLRKYADDHKYLGGPAPGTAVAHDARYWEIINNFAHPFGFRHSFYDVIQWRKGAGGGWEEALGQDAKKCVAFPPQSTAAGVIYAVLLRLFDPDSPSFIGDAFYGLSPLRALIHDELFMEVPEKEFDRVFELAVREMKREIREQPMPEEWGLGRYLTIGVSAKWGLNWGPKTAENPDGMRPIGTDDIAPEEIAADVWREEEEEDEEDAA